MLEAAACRPRACDELFEWLQDGRYWQQRAGGVSACLQVWPRVPVSGGRGTSPAGAWLGHRGNAERLCCDAGAGVAMWAEDALRTSYPEFVKKPSNFHHTCDTSHPMNEPARLAPVSVISPKPCHALLHPWCRNQGRWHNWKMPRFCGGAITAVIGSGREIWRVICTSSSRG